MISIPSVSRLAQRTLVFTLLFFQPLSNAAALTIENVTFPDTISIENKQIPLRGASLLRWLSIFKVNVAALYLPEMETPQDVLAEDIPKRLEISYLVSIDGPDFGKGAEAILGRNISADDLARLRTQIDKLNAVYRNVKPGDRYALT